MATGPTQAALSAEAAARDTLRRWYDAWNAHDVEAISALMTEDVRYEDPSAPSPVLDGRPAVEEYVRAAFAAIPDLRLDKLEEWVTPGGAVISSYFRFSGTFRAPLTAPALPPLAPTGGRLEILGMDRSEIRDGRLARHQIFWDMVDLGRQLAAFPPRGSRAERLSRRLQHFASRRLRRSGPRPGLSSTQASDGAGVRCDGRSTAATSAKEHSRQAAGRRSERARQRFRIQIGEQRS